MNSFDILSLAKQHLQDIADGKSGEELIAQYFLKEASLKELPNKLNVNGSTSDYNELIERSKKGKHIVMQQSFSVLHEHLAGNVVILEVLWKGVFTIPIGNTKPGGDITAHCALVMEFENGKIIKQRNYDCFEPF
jgi:hypothetical protein